jgi:hypothetical protein
MGGLTGESVLYLSQKKNLGKVPVNSFACLDCGHIELYLNPKQLRNVIKKE